MLLSGYRKAAKNEKLFTSFFENAPDALVLVNSARTIILVNSRCEKLFGYQRDELLGKGIEILIPQYREIHALHPPGPKAAGDHPQGVRKDGVLFPLDLALAFHQNEEALLVQLAIRDISHLVAESHEVRQLIEAVPDPILVLTPEARISDANAAALTATGQSRASLIGSEFFACFSDPERAKAAFHELLQRGEVNRFLLTMKSPRGTPVEVAFSASLRRDEAGIVLGGVAVARDVTEENRIATECAEAQKYLDNILQSSTKYSIVGMDLDRRIISWNEGGRRNYGYRADEIIGRELTVLHTETDVSSGAVSRLMKNALEKGVAEGEFTRVRKDGSHFEASVVVTRRDDLAGHPIGYLLMSSDISDRRKAEELLRQAAQYARSLIEASLDPLVTIGPEGKITDVNEAMVRVTGIPREELVGSEFAAHFTDPEKARQGYRQVFDQGHLTDYLLAIRNRNGSVTEVLYNASVFRDLAGAVLGAFAAARDITQRRRVDQELMEAASILAAASAQIMATMAQVASAATETAATVSETTAITEEAKQSAQLSNSKAQAVLEVARTAVEMAQGGRKAVAESVAGMRRIQEEMASIGRSIMRLSEQSTTIGEIIETVKDLAEQSNLLAVNAAIEAAKAGEFGTGFEVVAQELRSLAEQSKAATSEVRVILEEIRKATKAAVLATEQGTQGVELGARQTEEAGEVIRHMAGSIEHSAEAAAQIAVSSREHLAGMDQIAKAMGNIQDASEQNVSGMRQVEATLQNLHALGQRLKLLVAQYQ